MIDRAMNTYFDALDSFDPTERGLTAARRVNANTEAETAALQHMRGLGVPVPHPDDYDYGEMWQSGYAPKVDAQGRVPLPPRHYRLAQEGFDVSGWADDEDPAISSTLLAWNDQQDALRLKLSPRTAGPNLGVLTDNEMTPARAEYEQKVLERIRQQLEGPSGLQNLLDAFQTLGTEARDLFPNDPTPTHIYDIEGAPPAPESTISGLDDLAFTGQRLNVAAVPLNSLRPWTASDVGAAMWQAGIDPTALRGLREQAAKIENVDQATLFINEQGLAVAHVRHGARIPDRYAKFASENNLELVVRDTYSGVNKPMPFEYRASGARYQNEFMDGRHLAAGAAGAAALGASGAASAGALPMKPKHQIGVWDKGQRGIYEDIVSGLLQKAGLSERGAMKGAQDLISGNTRSLGIGAADFDPITISEDVASAIKTNDWLGATLSALGLLPFAKPAIAATRAAVKNKPLMATLAGGAAAGASADAEASWASKLPHFFKASGRNPGTLTKEEIKTYAADESGVEVSDKAAELARLVYARKIPPMDAFIGDLKIPTGNGTSFGSVYMALNEDRVKAVMRYHNLRETDDLVLNFNAVIEKWNKLPQRKVRRGNDEVLIFGRASKGEKATGILLVDGVPTNMFYGYW